MSESNPPEIDLADLPAMEFGSKAWYGIAGLFGGAALVTAGVFAGIAIMGGSSSGRGARLPAYLVIFGLIAMGATFRVRGCRLSSDGIEFWTYLFWVLGSKQRIEPGEIQSFSLGESKGKFTVSIKHNGGVYEIPQSWATLKDAQNVIDYGNRSYNATAEVAITDEKVLSEAAAFSKAQRYTVIPEKATAGFSEKMEIINEAGGTVAPVFILKRFFRSTRASIPEGEDITNIRWSLVSRFWGSNICVKDGEKECADIRVTTTFLGQKTYYHWQDTAGVYWSSMLEAASEARNPLTLKMFRGLMEGAGKKDERARCEETQGNAVTVAVADGPAERFNLDMADESAWPWVRLALAAVWVHNRPTFSFHKKL